MADIGAQKGESVVAPAAGAVDRLGTLHLGRAQALAQAIEEDIAEQGLARGTKLGTKTELSTQFGVAASTVNEAVRVLQNRGVVQIKPGAKGGVFVEERSGWLELSQLVLGFKNSASAVAEVFAVRDALEGLIDTEAGRNHSPSDIVEIEGLLERMEEQVFDAAAYLHCNWEFHRRVSQLCRNEFARSLYGGLLDFAESQLADVLPHDHYDGRENLVTHVTLVKAIAFGDEAVISAAVRDHNREARVARS